MAAAQVPLVGYLALTPEPHLVANECENCGARFFDRRNACGSCGGRSFVTARVATTGHLRSFSIVHRADPRVQVPFVSAIVETTDGTTVRANLVDVPPDPGGVTLGMPVRLVTYAVGTDSEGTECVAFGFEPMADPTGDGIRHEAAPAP